MKKTIVLGSQSPRREKIMREILGDKANDVLRVMTAPAEEIKDASDPVRSVIENARRKYEAVRKCDNFPKDALLITADTLVWLDGKLIGKPKSLEEAALYLRNESGRTQIVFTGIAIGSGDAPKMCVEASSVTFKNLSEKEIASYIRDVNPIDRAGAYDIDESGMRLIASYSGSYTNIMGLPREVVAPYLHFNSLM